MVALPDVCHRSPLGTTSKQGLERIRRREKNVQPWVWVIIAIAAVLFLVLLFRSFGRGGGRRVIVRRPVGAGRPLRRRRWN